MLRLESAVSLPLPRVSPRAPLRSSLEYPASRLPTRCPSGLSVSYRGAGLAKPLQETRESLFRASLIEWTLGKRDLGKSRRRRSQLASRSFNRGKAQKSNDHSALCASSPGFRGFNPSTQHLESSRLGTSPAEKGQDILLDALSLLGDFPIEMTFAGGLRRDQDKNYFETCLRKASKLSPQIKVNVTGFVSPDLDRLAKQAHLAVAPFRDTSGSASLTYLIARDCPILTSDHPLNLDMATRVPGLFAVYPKDEPARLAGEIRRIGTRKKNWQSSDRRARFMPRSTRLARSYDLAGNTMLVSESENEEVRRSGTMVLRHCAHRPLD